MNIAYCSLLLPEEKKLAERAKERLSGISGHKVTSATIKGIDENLKEPVTVFNIINTLNYPKFPQLIFRDEKWSHAENSNDWHIGYVNLFGIKYITQAVNLYNKLDKWVKSKHGEKCIICVHYIYYPAMIAANRIKKKYKDQIILCLNTGDIPGKYGLKSQAKPNIKGYLTSHIVDEGIMNLAKQFDCFVFVTKDMAKAFGVENKPFTVLECTCDIPFNKVNINSDDVQEDEKIIFYAGALREEYGIPHLLRAFTMIKDSNYRLWLAGGGSAVPMIKEYEKRHSNIEYLGFLTPQQVEERQRKSTVLISPRIAGNYEYVKYSFPSKTMECLASGKPYIAHKLPCDPPEYADYIQYAKDETDESLRDKIVQICSLTKEQRDQIGIAAKKFVYEQKNPIVMTKRIVEMWKSMEGGNSEIK